MPTLPTVQDANNNFLDTVPDKGSPGSPNLNNAEIFGVRAAVSAGAAPGSADAAAAQQKIDMARFFPDGTRTGPTTRVDPDKITTTSVAGAPADYVDPASKTGGWESASKQRYADLGSYAQALTDSINTKYNSKVMNDKEYIASQDARARVLNTRTGLNDSGTGAAALDTVKKKGDAVLAADEAARTSEIGVALGKIDTLRNDQVKADALSKQQDLKNYNDQRSLNQKNAIDSLTALAKSGTDLEQLKTKEPDSYTTLQKELGLSDLEMTAKYNALKPTPAKMNYKVVGDTIVAYGVDKDGKLVEQQQSVPGLSSGNYSIHELKDGTILKLNKDTGEYSTLRGAPEPGHGNQTTQQKNEADDALNWLARQDNYDSKVDKDNFENDESFRAWAINEAKKEKAKSKSSSGGSNPFAS